MQPEKCPSGEKSSGGAAGLFVGGSGRRAGGRAGGAFPSRPQSDPGVTFTIAVVALAGKMAKADGVATEQEFDIFRRIFGVPPQEEANVRRVFNLARQDIAGFEHYAGQIAQPVPRQSRRAGRRAGHAVRNRQGRWRAASRARRKFLERVAEIFGFAPNEFRRIRASHFAPELTDPYVILGVSYVADEDEIRQTYRRLVRENHPDSLIARGVPAEFIKLATDKLAAINGAYEKIRAERGLA